MPVDDRKQWVLDPALKLPRGAIIADTSKHNAGYGVLDFYIDITLDCTDCGKAFVFSATEQKYWYEELRFNIASVPIRCAVCRKAMRTVRIADGRYSAAAYAVKTNPHAAPTCEAFLSAHACGRVLATAAQRAWPARWPRAHTNSTSCGPAPRRGD